MDDWTFPESFLRGGACGYKHVCKDGRLYRKEVVVGLLG